MIASPKRELLERCIAESSRCCSKTCRRAASLRPATPRQPRRGATRACSGAMRRYACSRCPAAASRSWSRRARQPGHAGRAPGRQRADREVRRPRRQRRRLLVPRLHRRDAVVVDRGGPGAPPLPRRRAALAARSRARHHWLLAQEHQHFRLLQQNEASDWADIMPRSGFVLYTNALWYAVKRRFDLPHADARTTTSITCSIPHGATCRSTTAPGCCATTWCAASATPGCT